MIAKIIASGPTRDAAPTLIERFATWWSLGIATNRETHPDLEAGPFRSGRIHTGVLDEIGPCPRKRRPRPRTSPGSWKPETAPSANGPRPRRGKAPDPWACNEFVEARVKSGRGPRPLASFASPPLNSRSTAFRCPGSASVHATRHPRVRGPRGATACSRRWAVATTSWP